MEVTPKLRQTIKPSFRWPYYICIMIIAAWTVYAARTWISAEYVPDEAWFYAVSLSRAWPKDPWGVVEGFINRKNDFGYGGLWWAIYDLLSYTLPSEKFAAIVQKLSPPEFRLIMLDSVVSPARDLAPLWLMRLISLFALLSFLILLAWKSRTPIGAVCAVLSTLMLPMIVWSGKIASPELPAAALLAIAALLHFRCDSVNRAGFLLGLAAATKLTVLPAGGGWLLVFILHRSFRNGGVQATLRPIVVTFAGFLLGSTSFVAVNGLEYVEMLRTLSGAFPLHDFWARAWLTLIETNPMWEMTPVGSLLYWMGSFVVPVSVLVISYCWPEVRRFAAWWFFSLLLMFLFMMSQPSHNWYWFPLILSAPIGFALSPIDNAAGKVAAFAGCIHLSFAGPALANEIHIKHLHRSELLNFDQVSSCIAPVVARLQPSRILDMATIGRDLFKNRAGTRRLDFHDSWVALHAEFAQLHDYSSSKPGGTLTIFGQRMQAIWHFWPVLAATPFGSETGGECVGAKWRYVGG